jgi:hypothetical protein
MFDLWASHKIGLQTEIKLASQLFVNSMGTTYNKNVIFGDDVLVDIHNFPIFTFYVKIAIRSMC